MYKLTLEGKRVKRNQVTGMHLMAGLLLLVMGLLTWLVPNSVKQDRFEFLNWAGLAYAVTGLLIIITCIFFNKKVINSRFNFLLRGLEIFAMGSILAYSIFQQWYLPAGYSLAALLGIMLAFYWEKKGKQHKIAHCTDEGIHINDTLKFRWQEIRKVLFRHNIFTVDCKNNKLYQYTVITHDETSSAGRADFESYCRVQIKAKEHLYKEEW